MNINVQDGKFTLPPGLRVARFQDAERGPYFLALSESHSDYEIHLGNGPDQNARLLMRLLKGEGTLVDVGANIGTISVPVAASGSRVIAVEMNHANCLRLWTAAALNRLSNIYIVQAAASDYDGTLTYEGSEAWGYVSDKGTSAICLRLDTMRIATSISEPLAIKIDVEGHEPAVLRGARHILAQCRPAVLFECIEIEGSIGNARASKEILEAAGYVLFLQRGNVLVPRTSKDPQEGYVADFLAVPVERRDIVGGIGAEVRSLTNEERAVWIREMAAFPVNTHQRHAAKMLLRWSLDEAALCRASLDIVPALLDLEHLRDLHDALRSLL